MKFAFWNCRGIGKKNFWTDLKITTQNEHIDMIMLAEIKTDKEPLDYCWRSAGFDNCFFIPSVGRAGGLCLLWKEFKMSNEKIKIIQNGERYLVIEHWNKENKFICNIIFIYAPPMEKGKDEFWKEITNIVKILNNPSMIIGDFNDLLAPTDKAGGNIPSSARFHRINNVLQECNMMDLISRGNEFTWRKRKEGADNTFEKLDRTLAHFEIVNKYNQIHTWNHAFTTSDHNMISINLFQSKQKYKSKPFRYEMMWNERKDCKNVIKQAWRLHVPRTPMFKLCKKINLTKAKIKVWSKNSFGNVNRQVKKIDMDIENLQNENYRNYNQARNENMLRLNKKRECLIEYQRDIGNKELNLQILKKETKI